MDVSMIVYLESFDWGWPTPLECRQHHSMGWGCDWVKVLKGAEQQHAFSLRSSLWLQCSVTSGLIFLFPCLLSRDELYPREL